MARVRLEHVYKWFNNVEVVHDINLDVRDKEFLVLVGPSGCGKSTCLRMIAGLEEVSEGEIFIGDRLVNDVPAKNRDIAMVFQNYALYPHMTVFENMAFGLKLRRVHEDHIKQRVHEAADMLGLEPLLKRKPRQLSGGQRQRVALGRALVREPQVFLMDEPLSNLDAKLRVETRANIIRLHQRIQTTVIYVTHDQTEAMTMGTRIAVLNGGVIQQVGTPQELYDHPRNLFVAGFIGSPAMNFLDGAQVVSHAGEPGVRLVGLGSIKIPPQYKERVMAVADRKLTFGVRPEHLENVAPRPTQEENYSTFDAPVDVVEYLGSELLVSLNIAGQTVHARLRPDSGAQAGGKLALQINSARYHLFDTETGETIF